MKVIELLVGSDEAACLYRGIFHEVGEHPQITVDRDRAECVEFPCAITEQGFYEGSRAVSQVLRQLETEHGKMDWEAWEAEYMVEVPEPPTFFYATADTCPEAEHIAEGIELTDEIGVTVVRCQGVYYVIPFE